MEGEEKKRKKHWFSPHA